MEVNSQHRAPATLAQSKGPQYLVDKRPGGPLSRSARSVRTLKFIKQWRRKVSSRYRDALMFTAQI